MIYVSGIVKANNIDHFRVQYQSAKDYLIRDVWVYEDQKVFTLIDLYDKVLADKPIDDYMMHEELEDRIELVKKCSCVYFLMGWEHDDMCRVEHVFAKAYGKRIVYSKKF